MAKVHATIKLRKSYEMTNFICDAANEEEAEEKISDFLLNNPDDLVDKLNIEVDLNSEFDDEEEEEESIKETPND